MKFKPIGLIIFIVGLLTFHMNTTIGFLYMLIGGTTADLTEIPKGMMLIIPGFYTPAGAILMVVSGYFFIKKKKEVTNEFS
ncbi:MAG: hypothetical protein KOO66_11205 [Bacteroidales bacterium]|nr:hypothetical protein [Bacteroidales bacterium]